jgi:hypothetical protein
MKTLLLATTLCIGALVADIPSEAGTIYVSYNEMGPYGYNLYTGGTLGAFNGGPFPSDYNGLAIMTANEGSSPALPTYQVWIWCIDQPGYMGLGTNPSPDGTGIVFAVDPLASFTTDFIGDSITSRQASEIAAVVNIGDQMLTASPSDVVANAVQAAITDIEYGTTSDGGAAANAETTTLLTWASGLTDAQLAGYQADIYVPETDATTTQHLISAVPEPSTLLLLGSGFLAARYILSGKKSPRP